jgi:integrase
MVRWLESCNYTEHTEVELFKRSDLEEMRAWYDEHSGLSDSSIKIAIGSYNALINLARRDGLLIQDLTAKYSPDGTPAQKPKVKRQAIYTFSDKQIKRLHQYVTRVYLLPQNNTDVAEVVDGNFKRDRSGKVKQQNNLFIRRVNLAALIRILLMSGARVAEIRKVKNEDFRFYELEQKQHQNYQPRCCVMTVEEHKYRRKKAGHFSRDVVVSPGIRRVKEMVHKENPRFSRAKDLLLNVDGEMIIDHRYFGELLVAIERWATDTLEDPIVMTRSSEGATLTLSHLRSYYITRMLFDKHLPVAAISRNVGSSLETVQAHYLARRPTTVQMYQLAGHRYRPQVAQDYLNPRVLDEDI